MCFLFFCCYCRVNVDDTRCWWQFQATKILLINSYTMFLTIYFCHQRRCHHYRMSSTSMNFIGCMWHYDHCRPACEERCEASICTHSQNTECMEGCFPTCPEGTLYRSGWLRLLPITSDHFRFWWPHRKWTKVLEKIRVSQYKVSVKMIVFQSPSVTDDENWQKLNRKWNRKTNPFSKILPSEKFGIKEPWITFKTTHLIENLSKEKKNIRVKGGRRRFRRGASKASKRKRIVKVSNRNRKLRKTSKLLTKLSKMGPKVGPMFRTRSGPIKQKILSFETCLQKRFWKFEERSSFCSRKACGPSLKGLQTEGSSDWRPSDWRPSDWRLQSPYSSRLVTRNRKSHLKFSLLNRRQKSLQS